MTMQTAMTIEQASTTTLSASHIFFMFFQVGFLYVTMTPNTSARRQLAQDESTVGVLSPCQVWWPSVLLVRVRKTCRLLGLCNLSSFGATLRQSSMKLASSPLKTKWNFMELQNAIPHIAAGRSPRRRQIGAQHGRVSFESFAARRISSH